MSDPLYADSIKLFFESFGKQLKRIRDEGKDANQAYRAQILLGQLFQFEKAIIEYQGTSLELGRETQALQAMMGISDLVSLVKWLAETQKTVGVDGVYYLNSTSRWETMHGSGNMPARMRVASWVRRGLLGRLAEPGRHYLAYVHGQPRFLVSLSQNQENEEDALHAFLEFLCRLLPLYIGSPVEDTSVLSGADAGFIARDTRFLELLDLISRVARKDVTILLEGESGTGKEVIANYISQKSSRCDKPFVAVNCAAIPAGLIESELFGHEKGAFTGAHQRKIGRVEEAQGGTLLLDEIGEIEMAMQAKLLRFLQKHELHRVGGRHKITVDVRIVAATNRDLKQLVAQGLFREDLYYRLSVAPFKLPPLRDRVDDIIPLTDFFLKKYAQEFNMPLPEVDGQVYQLLAGYPFPGNVRELENLVQSTLVLSQGEKILPMHLSPTVQAVEPKGIPVLGKRGAPVIWKRTAHGDRKIKLKCRVLARFEEPSNPSYFWESAVPQNNDELKQAKQEIQDRARVETLALEKSFLNNLLERTDNSMPLASKLSNINRTLLYKMLDRTKE